MTRAAAGFSLIELVIVVTIVSVLALTVTLGFTTEGRLTGTRDATPARAAEALETAVARARPRDPRAHAIGAAPNGGGLGGPSTRGGGLAADRARHFARGA